MKLKPNKTETTKTTELGELLKTENAPEQVKRVQELISAATAPVFYLTVVFDPRVGKAIIQGLQSNGGSMEYAIAHQILDAARTELVKAETEKKAKTETAEDK